MTSAPQKKRKLTLSDKVESSINGSSKNDEQKMTNSDEVQVFINGRSKSKARFYKVEDTEPFQVSSNYEPIKIIGRGAFGVVCSALNTKTDEQVAIKKISIQDSTKRALQTLREIKISRHLRKHKAIVELKDIMIPALPIMSKDKKKKKKKKWDFKNIYLVFELMESNLFETIHSGIELKDEDYQHILVQLLFGLHRIHLANIIHRDLKPANLLVDKFLTLKICDFGLSRAMRISQYLDDDDDDEEIDARKEITNSVVTRDFRAPELTLGCKQYDNAVDIWSVGCIFAELVNKKPLFHVKTNDDDDDDDDDDDEEEEEEEKEDQFDAIISKLGTSVIGNPDELYFIDNQEGLNRVISAKKRSVQPAVVPFSGNFPNLNPDAIELLERLLVFDPWDRITVEGALRHRYIQKKFEALKDDFEFNKPITELTEKMEDEKSLDTIRDLLWNEMLSFHRDQNPNYDDDDDDDDDDLS